MKTSLRNFVAAVNVAFSKRYIQVLIVLAAIGIVTCLHFDFMATPMDLQGLKQPSAGTYVQLESTFVNSEKFLKMEPSFSGETNTSILVRTAWTIFFLVLIGVGLLSYQEKALKGLERQQLKQNKE